MQIIQFGICAILFGLANSQQATLPACAQGCVTQYTSGSAIGSCPGLDIKCICSDSSFLSSIACCLISVCSAADQAAAIVYAKQICATAGVTVPDAVECNSASSSIKTTVSSAVATAGSSSIAIASSTSSVAVVVPGETPTTHVTSSGSTSRTGGSGTTTTAYGSSSTASPMSTSPPSPDPSGLSTGAIAGISIGVVIPIIVISLAIFLCCRRRRKGTYNAQGATQGIYNIQGGPLGAHRRTWGNQLTELPTRANTHELRASQEPKEWPSNPNIGQSLPEVVAYELHDNGSEQRLEGERNIAEMYGNPTQNTTFSAAGRFTTPAGLSQIGPTFQEPEVSSRYTGTTFATSPFSNSNPSDIEGSGIPRASRLDVLRGRMDKVRAEKERLAKMQELDEMEAELQREILNEQRRECGLR